ncbi:MAG: PASTA domain-containing protein [Clostridiales bacterium]|jgi:stage V sporulation protein D (sporulation-specific penicillin-binding protein)|nr:PASTA domain-containing protein [Clostridiales bacterium]
MDGNRHEFDKYQRLSKEKREDELRVMRHRKIVRTKLRLLCSVFVLSVFGLLGRIWYLKAEKGAEFENIALQNQENLLSARNVNSNRGAILDRNRQNLAISNVIYEVILDVRLITEENEKDEKRKEKGYTVKTDSELTFPEISEAMGISVDELNQIIAKDANGKLVNDTHRYRLGYVSYEQAQLMKANENITCVFYTEESERNYLNGNFAPQVIGFMSKNDQWGIEKRYNQYLKGENGLYYYYGYDGASTPGNVSPVAGSTVVTTLDYQIQQFAQQACDKMMEEYDAENTSVIVLNPLTGEILGMAESPTFDLNDPANIELISESILKENLEGMEYEDQMETINKVWGNYNLGNTFEPGSIFKPIVVAAALEENIITTESPTSYYCGGSRTYAGWHEPIKCHLVSGHGQQTLDETLSNSCNCAMMEIGGMLGRDLFYKYQRDFGFGETTGIDLPAEESAQALIYSVANLNDVQLATSSFGQGFNCTPIQAINAFAAVINGGNLMRPYVVSQVIDENGNVAFENSPQVVRKVISKETSDYLRNTLVKVVSDGTGKKAAIEGFNIGGKTGTGQQGIRDAEKYTVSFIAYLPAENPEILAMTLIDKPSVYIEGSTSAAPRLREVLLDIINYKGIQPSNGEASIPAAEENAELKIAKNYIGMSTNDAIAAINKLGVKFEIIGAGGSTVTNQTPPEGSAVDETSVIFLNVDYNENDELIVVPELSSLTRTEAENTIINCGLTPVVLGSELTAEDIQAPDAELLAADNGEAGSGETGNIETGDTGEDAIIHEYVMKQMPHSGVKVPKGTQIIIEVE